LTLPLLTADNHGTLEAPGFVIQRSLADGGHARMFKERVLRDLAGSPLLPNHSPVRSIVKEERERADGSDTTALSAGMRL